MDAFTPQQTIELIARTGCKKAHMRLDKLFINSCMASPLLGFGCAVLVSVNASPWYQEYAPGLIRMIGALLFPIGLVMISQSGADLFTTNIMYMTAAYLSRRVYLKDVLISWLVSFFGNLAGMLFFVTIICGYGGIFEEDPAYQEAAIRIAIQKAQKPQWQMIFLRGIGANWLVCFAIFSATQGRELVSKIVAIWWPTATFVALALDHVVANMFFIPMGIWVGAPLEIGYYIWKSMIPAALGNMVGGGIFVGVVYWYLYLTGEDAVKVAFDLGGEQSTVEGAAGPLRLDGQDPFEHSHDGHHRQNSSAKTPTNPGNGGQVKSPGGGGHMMSSVGMDLRDNGPYAKTWMEREMEAGIGRSDNGDEKV